MKRKCVVNVMLCGIHLTSVVYNDSTKALLEANQNSQR